MIIEGRRYRQSQVLVLSSPVEVARHPAGVPTCEHPCRGCGRTLLIEVRSRNMGREGSIIMCIRCAHEHYPETTVGRARDDGRVVTLREAVALGWIELQ